MKQYDQYDEDELREALTAQYADDLRVLRERGYFHPPWMNIDYIAKESQVKFLTAVADNGGHIEYDKELWRDIMGTKAVANSTAEVNSCVRDGYLQRKDDYLMLTFYGRDVLEHVEEHGNF